MYEFKNPLNKYKVLLPENRYICKILDIKETKNKDKTKNMIVVELDIDEGNYATCLSDKPLKKYIVEGEYFDKALAGFALMVRQSNKMPVDVKTFNANEFIGLRVGAFINQKEDSYQGKDFIKNQIVYFCTVEDCLNFKYEPKVKKSTEKTEIIDPENTDIPF